MLPFCSDDFSFAVKKLCLVDLSTLLLLPVLLVSHQKKKNHCIASVELKLLSF
jgi:hypothetical protein